MTHITISKDSVVLNLQTINFEYNMSNELYISKRGVKTNNQDSTASDTKLRDRKKWEYGIDLDVKMYGDNNSAGIITNLTSGINSSVTTINVNSTTGFDTTGWIWIGSEQIKHTGKTATSFTGCERGSILTNPAAHGSGIAVHKQFNCMAKFNLLTSKVNISEYSTLGILHTSGDLTITWRGKTFTGSIKQINFKESASTINKYDDSPEYFDVKLLFIEGTLR